MSHPVTSRPIAPARYRSQVIPSGCMAGGAIVLLWFVAIVLLAISTLGNYVLFVGGWEQLRWPTDRTALIALACALVLQAVCSVAQWGFKALKLWAAYGVALLASVIPSFLAYNAGVGPWLEPQIGIFSAAAIFLVAMFIDMLPEWILVT